MHTERWLLAATPQLGHYDIDVSSSAVSFQTRHLFGLAPVRGAFAFRSGTVDVAEPLADSGIHADIESASFRTGNPQRDRSVRSARLLNSAQFPLITFRKGRVSADDRTISGELTVRGVTRAVTLPVRLVTVSGESFTASVAIQIDRTEFGVTALRGLAARYLDMTVEVRCIRK